MSLVQVYYKNNANRNRRPARRFLIKQKVWLNAKNLKIRRLQKKLDWKLLNSFTIIKIVSSYFYELRLLSTIRIHPVFYVDLLRSAADNPLPYQVQEPPPPVEIDGIEEWDVEDVVDSRWKRRGREEARLRYTVK